MIFGWQGFQLDLPEGFAPVALTGNASEGYARLVGERDRVFQVRWLRLRPGATLEATVEAYLARLQKDAKRAKRNFSFTIDDGRYRLSGDAPGWGGWVQGAERGYILEVSGKSAALPLLRRGLDTFCEGTELWTWSVNDLVLRLPVQFKLEKSKFFAGKTELEFKRPRSLGHLIGQRWGFASRLLKDRSASDWAKSLLGWPGATVSEEPQGIRLSVRGRDALVLHDFQEDRLTVLSGPSRRIEWRPRWEWIVSESGCSEGERSRLTTSEAARS